jgi:YHS domain-containing protein
LASLAAIGMLATAPASDAAGPMDATLIAASDGSAFRLSSIASPYVALYFIGPVDAPETMELMSNVKLGAPTRAGVAHVFISGESRDAIRRWAATPPAKEAPASIYADPEASLSKELGIGQGTTGVVVLTREGKELFRIVGGGHLEHPRFDAIAKRLDEATRAPALDEYNIPKGKSLAIEGYDPVAYFTRNKAIKGTPEIASRFRGIEYRFATPEDRAAFNADPEKYLPTYGGWCATALGAKGTKVEIDPTSFKVKGGRLFLFYKDFFSDALKDWNAHEKEWEPAADTNWKKISGEEARAPRKADPSGR